MQGKRVVLIGPAHPYRGGLSTFNERFAQEIALQNDIEMITFSLQYPGFLFPGQSQYSTDKAPQGLTIKRMINSVNSLSWIKTGLYLKKQKPDLIIFRYWMPFFGPAFGTIARIAKRNKVSKVMCIADNIIPHEKRIIDKPFNAYFLPSLDGAITMSRKVLQDLNDTNFKGKSAFHVHPLYDNFGPPKNKLQMRNALGIPSEAKLCLFFGFIRAYKGLDLLLQAMAQLNETDEHVHLLVAGEFYEDEKPYLELVDSLKLKNVHMHTQFIPNDEVANYFSAADLVVQPYKTATQSGVSQVAYHFELPMVVTNVGGLAEFVPQGKTGFVCEPNPTDIAESITKFFALENKVEMQANIKEFKKQFSWSSLLLVIDKLLFNEKVS
jgi:D-inositol-3-phosphate glycosyltransferase